MKSLKRLLVTITSGLLLFAACLLVEPANSAGGREAPQEKAPSAPAAGGDEIPSPVHVIIKKSGNRFAYTGFVQRALRRHLTATRGIGPRNVGAAPALEAVKTMQPAEVEDAVIRYAHALSGAIPPDDAAAQPRSSPAAGTTAAVSAAPPSGSAPLTNVLTGEVLSPTLPRFDWRDGGWVAQDSGIISAAKDQTLGGAIDCGCCWAFATIGTFEGADALLNRRLINASEQNLLDCAAQLLATQRLPYDCTGGWFAFDYLIQQGVATETDYKYTAQKANCNASVSRPYQASKSAPLFSSGEIPTTTPQVNQIKAALCQYGPIGVGVFASATNFGGYGPSSPPIKDFDSGQAVLSPIDNVTQIIVDHVVVIVGWNDAKQAWAIKNSWGDVWGTAGFGYIEYTANNIGYGATYVIPVNATAGQAAGAAPATGSRSVPRRALRTTTVPRLFPAPTPSPGASPKESEPVDLSPAPPPRPAAVKAQP